jgi:hypothetical protein
MAWRGGQHLCRRQNDFLTCVIEAHGAGARGSFDGLLDLEVAILCGDDRERSVKATGERMAAIETRGIVAGTDGQRGFDFAGLGAHDDHLFGFAAADEEALAGGINGHANGMSAGCDWPAVQDLVRVQVDYRNPILVFEIDEALP